MTDRTTSDPASKPSLIEIWLAPAFFLAFVVAGCVYIVLAKQHDVRQLLVTFVPVTFMLSYALIMALARFLRLRDDQTGDNLYYMGFLFTLTSLGASLYQFNSSGDADYIVRNFGIAIASTIAGITMRVLFNQMRRDPVEVERVARLELAEASRRVRTELDHTVLEFNHFRRTALQSLQEGFDEIATKVDKVGVQILAGLEDVTKKSAEPLEAASKQSGTTIEEMTRNIVASLDASARKLSDENERLSRSAATIAKALDHVGNRLDEMKAPDEVIRIRLDPTIKGLASAVDRFTDRIDQHEKVFGSALETARLSSEDARKALDAMRTRVSESDSGMREAMKSLSDTISAFEAAAKVQADNASAVLKRTEETLLVLKEFASNSPVATVARGERVSTVLPDVGTPSDRIDVAAKVAPPESESRWPRWTWGGRS